MRIDDFVCLGRTVPEQSKKYGYRVCMAGYSEELRSLIRVYPLEVQNPIRQRSVCRLELLRGVNDSRLESWHLNRELPNNGVDVVGEKEYGAVVNWLASRAGEESIHLCNTWRLSLAVIRPKSLEPFFRRNGKGDNPEQMELFEDIVRLFGADAAKWMPYLRFADAEGEHELQLREWGCYEWLRKCPGKESQLWDNLHLGDSDRDYYLVIGNMNHRRNCWLVINVYSARRELLFS
jgi:hypothetical protein